MDIKVIIFILLTLIMVSFNKRSGTNNRNQVKIENGFIEKNKIYQKNDSIEFIEVKYYSNGSIKSIIEQGIEQSCGIFTGTHFYFDSIGNLKKQVIYQNKFPKDGMTCIDIIQEKKIFEFYPNGSIRSKSQVQSSYQGEEIKIGEWIQYDKEGIEILREKH